MSAWPPKRCAARAMPPADSARRNDGRARQ